MEGPDSDAVPDAGTDVEVAVELEHAERVLELAEVR